MTLDEFKLLDEAGRKEYGKSIPIGITCDSVGNLLTFKNSDGYWGEYTRDSNRNVLTYKDSDEYWGEYTYDSDGNTLTYKNSYGANQVALCHGKIYTLYYDLDSGKYVAGCQKMKYKNCKKFFKENKDKFEDAVEFMKVIEEHNKGLH